MVGYCECYAAIAASAHDRKPGLSSVGSVPSSRRARLVDAVLRLVVGDGGSDGVLGQDRAVDLDRGQVELLDDLGVLDRQALVDGAALEPLGGQRVRRDGRAAPEALYPGVFD